MIAAMVLVIIPKSFALLRRIQKKILSKQRSKLKKRRSKQLLNHPFDQTNAAALNMSHSNILKQDPVLEDIDLQYLKENNGDRWWTGSGKSSLAKLL